MSSTGPSSSAAALRRIYKISFLARVVLGLASWFATVVLEVPIMEDAVYYSERASEAANCWLAGEQSPWLAEAIDVGRQAYAIVLLLAVFYFCLGGLQLTPIAIVAYSAVTALGPVLAYRSARQLGVNNDGARICAYLVAFSPAFLIWSSALYKEGLIVIAIFLALENGLRLQERFSLSAALWLAIAMILMDGLRFYMAVILTVVLLVALCLGRHTRNDVQQLPPMLRQVVVLTMIGLMFIALGHIERVRQICAIDLESILNQIQTSRQDLATTRSGYCLEADVSTVEGALAFLPEGLAYFLLVPLPWDFGGMRQNLTIPETLFWTMFIYPRVLRGIWYGLRRNPQGVFFLLLAAISVSLFYALFAGNVGTAYRMRIQVWAILAPLAGQGWYRLTESAQESRAEANRLPNIPAESESLPAPLGPCAAWARHLAKWA